MTTLVRRIEYTGHLSLPPSTNRIWRTTLGRRKAGAQPIIYLSPDARSWQRTAILLLQHAGWRSIGMPGPLDIDIDVHCNQRRDVDNCIKLLLDAVCDVLEVDDRWVQRLCVNKFPEPLSADYGVDITVHWQSS